MSLTQSISRLSLAFMKKETQGNVSGCDLEHCSGFYIRKGKVMVRNSRMRIKKYCKSDLETFALEGWGCHVWQGSKFRWVEKKNIKKFASLPCLLLASINEENERLQQQMKAYQCLNCWTAQRNSSAVPGDPAVSWIQRPLCHTEGLVTVALQRYSSWGRQRKGTIQVAVRDTIHILLPFIAPTHTVQSCTRPSLARPVLSLGCTQLPASFYLSKTSNLPLQTLTHSTSRYLLTGTQDFKDCFFLPPPK